MKIAILTPTFHHYSGIDRVVELQAEDYAKKGNKVVVYALESSINPKDYQVKVIGMPKSSFLQRIYRLLFFFDIAKIRKYSNELKGYDIVISHLYPMNWLAYFARKKSGIKYVYYNHGIGHAHLFNNLLERIYMSVFLKLSNLSLKNVDEAISVSRFLRKELKNESGIDSKVVYNRIDSKRFRKGIDGGKIRKLLRIGKNGKMLLFVGRISPHKNIHTLIKIFQTIKNKIPDARLVIVGKPTFGHYYSSLRKNANKDIIFQESVDDGELPHYYAACDVYATCSLWEGFDLPAAEAQACGKPVVAFDICSHPEIVKNGILVEKDDLEGFAEAVIKLIQKHDI